MCVPGRRTKIREDVELIEGVKRPREPATQSEGFSQQPYSSPQLRELTSAGKPVFPVVGLGPPMGAPPFCPSILLTDPRFRPARPPPSVGPGQLGATSGEGGYRGLPTEEGGPECPWTSLSLSPSGPCWENQGRVIPRPRDTLGVESIRAPTQSSNRVPLHRKCLVLWTGSLWGGLHPGMSQLSPLHGALSLPCEGDFVSS